MGYQVGVTPLQMISAVSSVANGGEMIEPRVIRAVYHDNRRYAVQPKTVRRTISADTAVTLTTIMEGVVERGTGRLAQMPGYSVAGKTGTAAKLVNGRYSTSDYNASFVGFVPSRNPAVAIIVVTDSPHGGPTTGGPVSGPVFKRIAEATLQYLGVGATINPTTPVLVARDDGAPSTHTSSADASEPVVSLVADGPPGTVPDFSGLSAREAVRRIVKLGMNASVAGDGFVISQDPAPGLPIEDDGVCHLVLERLPRHPASAARP